MLEVWVDKAEPAVRLLVRTGSGLPTELGSRDWRCLGPYEATPEVAREVAERGYHFFQSDEPVPDPETLKDANAAGA
jgi:hypothetical protein